MANKFLLMAAVILCCLVLATSCGEDPPKQTSDIIGTFTWDEWQKKSGWNDHSATDYDVDVTCCQAFSDAINNEEVNFLFEIYASNWCHADCEIQLPRIIKFLKTAGVDESSILIHGINRDKTEPADVLNKWNEMFGIPCRLPTLVIYENNNVLNRIKCETADYPDWQCNMLPVEVSTE